MMTTMHRRRHMRQIRHAGPGDALAGKLRPSTVGSALLGLMILTAGPVSAHPLGNASITHFSILHIHPDRVDLDLVLDFAEMPAAVLRRDEIDADGDGEDTEAERQAWLARKAEELAAELMFRLDGQRLDVRPLTADANRPHNRAAPPKGPTQLIFKTPGVANLPTYKIIVRFRARLPQPLGDTDHQLDYQDRTYMKARGLMRILLERTSLLMRLRIADPQFNATLDHDQLPQTLHNAFRQKAIQLSSKATCTPTAEGDGWVILDGDDRYLARYENAKPGAMLLVSRLPRIVVASPRPAYWDEPPMNPFIYEQYDPGNMPAEREATITFRIDDVASAAATTPPASAPAATSPSKIDERMADTGKPPAEQAPFAPYVAMLNDPRNDPAQQSRYQRDADRLIGLLQQPWGWMVFATVTVLCFGWGAAHALMPGHAKTLVAAYLISEQGTPFQAVFLAVVVTITHTALVVLLGVIIWAYQRTNPTLGPLLQLYLGIIAGLLVAGMGLTLVGRAMAGRAFGSPHHPAHGHRHHHPHHDHHHHDHDRHGHRDRAARAPHDHHDHHHQHTHELAEELPRGWREWLRTLFTHRHPHVPPAGEVDEATPGHQPPCDDRLSYRTLLLLGITGGIVPCPTATIIMLLGIGANVVAGALYAIGIFSLGLALTLMMVGFLALSSRRVAKRVMADARAEQPLSPRGQWLLQRALPTFSGLVVFGLGSIITAHYVYFVWTGTGLVSWIQ